MNDRRGAVVVLAAPGGGDGVLVDALARAPGFAIPAASTPPFPEAVAELGAGPGRWSHRLTAEDVGRRRVARAAAAAVPEGGRPLLWGLRLALRVPLISAVLPDARFVLVQRDLRAALSLALDGWRSGEVISAPELPDWPGPPWSLPLVAGWRELAGRPLPEIVGRQWAEIAETMLSDLEQLDPKRWCVVDRNTLLENPRDELRRLCGFLDVRYDQALLSPVEAARRSTAQRGPVPSSPELDTAMSFASASDARVRDVMAVATTGASTIAGAARPQATLASRASSGMATALDRLGVAVVITSGQAGVVGCVRADGRLLDTQFRAFVRPTAVVARGERIAVAAASEVWELREEPAETTDARVARFGVRRRHVIGDVTAVDLALAGDELWIACAEPSCLATLDAAQPIVPQWTPPHGYVTGVAERDGQVTHATVRTSDGGSLAAVASSELVAEGLSHPHSPRWHGEQLWLLEGGTGSLCTVDLMQGSVDRVTELPGYARGMAMAGELAFVGLSQARTPGLAASLPLGARLADRQSGVWAVDLRTGAIAGWLRFDDAVHEIDGLAVVHRRWPQLA